jgi:hypothetical protein
MPTTYTNLYWKKFFCDTKLNPQIKSGKTKTCPRCALLLHTSHCENGHKKICNGLGHFGWFCNKCQHFSYKTENFTSEELKNKHNCGFTPCRICRQMINPTSEEIHLCPIRKEKATKFWPCLAFLNIEFCEFNSNDCFSCFNLKKQFKDENNLSWKEVFEHKTFPNLCCIEHKNSQAILEPLLFIINKEKRYERGHFSNHIISNISQKKSSENEIQYNYSNNVCKETKFVPSKTISKTLSALKEKLNVENLTENFLSMIIDEEWTNTTIILNDEYSMKLVIFFTFKIRIDP